MTIKGLKKAVGDYQRANADPYSPTYGYMMLNRSTGELWTDEYCDLGHNSWSEYADPAIINIIKWASTRFDVAVTMTNVRMYADAACQAFRKEKDNAIY